MSSFYLRTIVTNPFFTVMLLLVCYFILKVLLIDTLNLSKKTWTKLDYIWIFVGFIGVISLVNNNRKTNLGRNISFNKFWLEKSYEEVLDRLNLDLYCYKQDTTRTTFYSLKDDTEIEKVCNWIYEVKENIERDFKNQEPLSNLPQSIRTMIKKFPSVSINFYSKKVDESILEINRIKKEKSSLEKWYNFNEDMGILILIFAFALRIVLITNKVRESTR